MQGTVSKPEAKAPPLSPSFQSREPISKDLGTASSLPSMSHVVNAIHTSIHPHTQVISRIDKAIHGNPVVPDQVSHTDKTVLQGLSEKNSLLEFPDSLIKRPVSLPTTDTTSGALGSSQVASPSEPLEITSMSTLGKAASVNEVSPTATSGHTAAIVKDVVSPRVGSVSELSPDANQDMKFLVPGQSEELIGAGTHQVPLASDDPYEQAESARNGESEEESAVSSANDLEILIAERELARKELEIAKLRKQASSKNSHRSGRSDKSRSDRRKPGKSALPVQDSSGGQPHSPTIQTLEGRLNAEVAETTSNLNAETLHLHNLSNDSRPTSPALDSIQEEHPSNIPKRENQPGEHLSPEQKKCRWTRKTPSESSPQSTVDNDNKIELKSL